MWSPRADLNRRPRPYQGRALPTELHGRRALGFNLNEQK